FKLLPRRRTDSLQDLPTICDRSLSSSLCGSNTAEENLERPAFLIGVFIVQKDRLVARIISRCIDMPAYSRTRRRSFLVLKWLLRYSHDESLKTCRRMPAKPSKEYRPMFQ